MRTISVKLPEPLVDQLTSEAQARKTTKSALIRESIEDRFRYRFGAGRSSCFDLASDLAGSIEGLPRDLADNPEYLKGFGV